MDSLTPSLAGEERTTVLVIGQPIMDIRLSYTTNNMPIQSSKQRQAKRSPKKDYYLDNGEQRFMQDGVNSVTYKLISYKKLPLFTYITVEFNYTETMGCVDSLRCSSQASNPLI